jgi:hypothetical protein
LEPRGEEDPTEEKVPEEGGAASPLSPQPHAAFGARGGDLERPSTNAFVGCGQEGKASGVGQSPPDELGEHLGIGEAGVHALPSDGAHDMGGVAREEDATGVKSVHRHAFGAEGADKPHWKTFEAVPGEPMDLFHEMIQQVGSRGFREEEDPPTPAVGKGK